MKSSWKQSEGTAGEWTWTAGKWYGDAEADKGIQTGPDARFYAISAPFPKISTEGKDLVVQVRKAARRGARRGGARARRLRSFPPVLTRARVVSRAVLREARAEARLRRRLHQAAPVHLVRSPLPRSFLPYDDLFGQAAPGASHSASAPYTDHLRSVCRQNHHRNMKTFGGDTEYSIMFGPDICGYSTKRVHVIFTCVPENHCGHTHQNSGSRASREAERLAFPRNAAARTARTTSPRRTSPARPTSSPTCTRSSSSRTTRTRCAGALSVQELRGVGLERRRRWRRFQKAAR